MIFNIIEKDSSVLPLNYSCGKIPRFKDLTLIATSEKPLIIDSIFESEESLCNQLSPNKCSETRAETIELRKTPMKSIKFYNLIRGMV